MNFLKISRMGCVSTFIKEVGLYCNFLICFIIKYSTIEEVFKQEFTTVVKLVGKGALIYVDRSLIGKKVHVFLEVIEDE